MIKEKSDLKEFYVVLGILILIVFVIITIGILNQMGIIK